MIENKVIAIDFDGTITKENLYPDIGELRENAIDCIKKLQEHNHCFLFTCRQGKPLLDALYLLEKNGVKMDVFSPYDYSVAYGRKPIADYYIDDRAILIKSLIGMKLKSFLWVVNRKCFLILMMKNILKVTKQITIMGKEFEKNCTFQSGGNNKKIEKLYIPKHQSYDCGGLF